MTNDPDKSSKRDLAPRYSDPFSALRSEVDSLFDTFMGGLPAFSGMFGPSRDRGFSLAPHIDVRESDKELVLEAELPGINEKDISLDLQNSVLTIRGEKKHEHDEEKENLWPTGLGFNYSMALSAVTPISGGPRYRRHAGA